MKTYPVMRHDGSVQYFEIGCTWNSIRSIQQVLKKIDGVSSIKFGFGHDRLTFLYLGECCVVHDPDGGEGGFRYRISPRDFTDSPLDFSAIQTIFANHRSLLAQLWSEFRSKGST